MTAFKYLAYLFYSERQDTHHVYYHIKTRKDKMDIRVIITVTVPLLRKIKIKK